MKSKRTMPTLTISVRKDQSRWVRQQAKQCRVPISQIIRQLIDQAKT